MRQDAAVRLFVGGQFRSVQGEVMDLGGDLEFSPRYEPRGVITDPARTAVMLDSGAFSDPIEKRLSVAGALERQLAWEAKARTLWGLGPEWTCYTFVSYDVLIDELWVGSQRRKERWAAEDAEWAIRDTIAGAAYLGSTARHLLGPRIPMLSVQGVDADQYQRCAAGVLEHARPGDWLGLGGWCILGRNRTMLPVFWDSARRLLPMAVEAGIDHIHLLGVTWDKALAGLVWLADQHGISVSTDSTRPVTDCTRKNHKKSGARRPYWRDNVAWWIEHLASLRRSEHYREPPV